MFEFLGQILDSITRVFFPRIEIIRTTHGGVKFKRGKHEVRLGPGVHIYWALVTEIEQYPVVRTTLNLPEQNVITGDGENLGVSGIVVYRVKDVLTALTTAYDLEDVIRDIALAVIRDAIAQREYEWIIDGRTDIDTEITRRLREGLEEYGIHVVQVTLSDIAKMRVLGLWGVSVSLDSGE